MSIHDDGIATIEEIREWWRSRCGEREGFEHDELASLGRLVDRRFRHDRLQLEAARARERAAGSLMIWPATIFEPFVRTSEAVRRRTADRSAFGWDYAQAANTPRRAWSVLKDSLTDHEHVLVAYRRDDSGEECVRTRGPFYRRDWAETYDPQFLPEER